MPKPSEKPSQVEYLKVSRVTNMKPGQNGLNIYGKVNFFLLKKTNFFFFFQIKVTSLKTEPAKVGSGNKLVYKGTLFDETACINFSF